MFDQKRIAEISQKSKSERWDYPRTFNALKEAGVQYYETQVSDHQITYYGSGPNLIEPAPADFQTLQVSQKFDAEAVGGVIRKHQTERTSYGDFLKGIALAGV